MLSRPFLAAIAAAIVATVAVTVATEAAVTVDFAAGHPATVDSRAADFQGAASPVAVFPVAVAIRETWFAGQIPITTTRWSPMSYRTVTVERCGIWLSGPG
jgi:hypothetical protein